MALRQSLAHDLEDPELAGTDSDSDAELLDPSEGPGAAPPGRSARQRGLLLGIASVCSVALALGVWVHGGRPHEGRSASDPIGEFLQEWGKGHSHHAGGRSGGGGAQNEHHGHDNDEHHGHHGHGGFHAVDTNGDGQVDSDEVEALCGKVSAWVSITADQCKEGFETADANKDDVLDKEEVRPFLHELKQVAEPGSWNLAKRAWKKHGHIMKELKELDQDGDGELAGEELTALAAKLQEHFDVSDVYEEAFKAADGNSDGKLQRSEVPKLLKALCKAKKDADGDDDDEEVEDADDGEATADGSDLPGFAI